MAEEVGKNHQQAKTLNPKLKSGKVPTAVVDNMRSN